jgi:hypothetical protein
MLSRRGGGCGRRRGGRRGCGVAGARRPSPAGGAGWFGRSLEGARDAVVGASHAAEHARQLRSAGFAAGAEFGGPLEPGPFSGATGSYAERESLSAAAVADPRAEAGAWSAPFALPLYAIHAAVLPTGRCSSSARPVRFSTNTTSAVLWDPATGTQELVTPPLAPDPMDGNKLKPANIYCSGQAFLADGQLLIAGGTLDRDASGTRFRATAVPVVTWEHALFDDMGMTGATLNTDFGFLDGQTALRVLAPGHPLAAGLSGTPLVATSPQMFSWGRPGAAAVNAAALTGDSTRSGVFGYTTGATMFGLSAPARSVGLFLSNNGVGALNTDGAKLFDAAISWADG